MGDLVTDYTLKSARLIEGPRLRIIRQQTNFKNPASILDTEYLDHNLRALAPGEFET